MSSRVYVKSLLDCTESFVVFGLGEIRRELPLLRGFFLVGVFLRGERGRLCTISLKLPLGLLCLLQLY